MPSLVRALVNTITPVMSYVDNIEPLASVPWRFLWCQDAWSLI